MDKPECNYAQAQAAHHQDATGRYETLVHQKANACTPDALLEKARELIAERDKAEHILAAYLSRAREEAALGTCNGVAFLPKP